MRLNKTVEIAINLISRLKDKPIKTLELSQSLNVSKGYMHQIIRKLSSEGLIMSTTGRYGGVRRVPDGKQTVSLYDIIEALAPGSFTSDLKGVVKNIAEAPTLDGPSFRRVEDRIPFGQSDKIRKQLIKAYKDIQI